MNPVEAWESRIKWFLEARYLKELNRIDEEPMEFEWKNFPGFTTLGVLAEIQKMITESMWEPELTLIGETRKQREIVLRNQTENGTRPLKT